MHAVELFERHIETHGAYERIVDGDRRLSSLGVRSDAMSIAAGLRDHGVAAGDRVIVMLGNRAEVPILYEAIWRAGAVIVPLLPSLSDPEFAAIVHRTEPRAIVAASNRVDAAHRAIAPNSHVLVFDVDGKHAQSLATLSRQSGTGDAQVGDADELAAVLFTGGTTGRSKGVMLSHRNLTWHARAVADIMHLRPGDVALVALPLSHSYGIGVLLNSYLERMRLVLMARFLPDEFVRTIQAESVTMADAVPTMLQQICDLDPSPRIFASMRWIGVGGAPCPVDLVERFRRMSGVAVFQGYGLTEAGPTVTADGSTVEPRPGSCGPPLPGVRMRVVDPQGADVPEGEAGEIVVRSPGVMSGYWRDQEATDDALRGGWLHTGDVGRVDADGYLYLIGRTKELIIRNGYNIYPLDVEQAIRGCAGVEDVIAVGVPDDVRGENLVIAYVGSATPDEVDAYSRAMLSAHKAPDAVRRVSAIPRTGIGKPDRRAMSDEFQREGSERA